MQLKKLIAIIFAIALLSPLALAQLAIGPGGQVVLGPTGTVAPGVASINGGVGAFTFGGGGVSCVGTTCTFGYPGVTADGNTPGGITVAGTIAASAMVSATRPVFDVTHPTYGAVADYNVTTGIGTDNAPAFEAAACAAQSVGGTLYIPSGKYLLNSVPSGACNPNSNPSYIVASGDGIKVQCAPGAVIYGGTAQSSGIYPTVFYLDATYANQNVAYATPSSTPNRAYVINPFQSSGATSVTMTTPSDAGNFTAGDTVYMLGNLNQDCSGNGELNWVVSSDAGTGIVQLRYPLIKPYAGALNNVSSCHNGNQGDSTHPFAGMVKATGQFWSGVSVDGCEVHAAGDFASIGQAMGVKLTNNKYYWTPLGTRGMFMNSGPAIYDIEIASNTINDAWLQIGQGQQNFKIHDNTWVVSNRPVANGAINVSEAAMNVDISHNVFSLNGMAANGGTALIGTTNLVYGLNIRDNFIQSTGQNTTGSLSSGIQFNNGGATPCVNCSAIGNTIVMSSQNAAGIDAKSPGLLISNNVITGAAQGIRNINGGTIASGNQITLPTPCPATNGNCYGLIVQGISGSMSHTGTIVGNTINGTTASSNITGIYVPNDGALTDSAVIVGNRFSNVGQPLSYTSASETPFVQANQCDSTVTTPGTACGTTLKTTGLADWSSTAPTLNYVPEWNGTQWVPTALPGGSPSATPSWLQYLGDGSGGAVTCTTTLPAGPELWLSSLTVNAGQTCKVAARGEVIRVTGACTINGTLDASAIGAATTGLSTGGGAGGGGGGGTAAGTAGSSNAVGSSTISSGSAGASSGGTGGNGSAWSVQFNKAMSASGPTADYGWGGGQGGAGGSSGGAVGNGGEFAVLSCGSLTGTGTIRADGGYGIPAAANTQGAGGGGGGGVIVVRSPANTSTLTLITNGAPGGSCTVPQAQWYGGGNTGLTTTTTVGGGNVTACSVGGTLTNWLAAPNCAIVGGGGTAATCHFTTSGSSPSLTITGCVVDTQGSGYTASTFTTCGAGGNGASGWSATFSN
jgi:hypothetical protein